MPIDEAKFKLAMSHFASGVTVVTTLYDGKPYGLTVASFASLSLRPPLVLVCIEKNVRSHDAIAGAGRFAVNILGSGQADISGRFASKIEEKFEGLETKPGQANVPLIRGALCTIECRVHDQLPGGDHSIFVGEVLEIQTGEGAPLVYYRSGYREISL